jgi:uncharacterized protein YraI
LAGYRKVSYQGTPGWAHGDYLEITNGGSTDTPVPAETAVTTTSVNLRSGPSTGHQVLRVVGGGEAVEVTNRGQNGFIYVIHEGLAGWMAGAYLASDSTVNFYLKTTSSLNLRESPSTQADVMAVMPKGAKVGATNLTSNGFRQVVYKGQIGWAYEQYLAVRGGDTHALTPAYCSNRGR